MEFFEQRVVMMPEKLEKVDAIVRDIHVRAGLAQLTCKTFDEFQCGLREIRNMAFEVAVLLREVREENMPKTWGRW